MGQEYVSIFVTNQLAILELGILNMTDGKTAKDVYRQLPPALIEAMRF